MLLAAADRETQRKRLEIQRETSEEHQEALFKRNAPLRSKLRSDQRNPAGSLPNNHRKRLTETRRTEQLLVRDRRLKGPSGFNSLGEPAAQEAPESCSL